MHIKIFLITLFSVLALCGCAAKNAGREKDHVPVKCDLKVPLKPAEDNSFEAHKELMRYFLKCEEIAKDCTRSE